MYIRVSYGTLSILGLQYYPSNVKPNIAYIMQYDPQGCLGKCSFCSQSRYYKANKEFLSRIVWPKMDLNTFLTYLSRSSIRRVCLQTIIKKNFIREAHIIVKSISDLGKSISLSITPIPKKELINFRNEGVDYLGVGLDAASPELLVKLNKPYDWDTYWRFIVNGIDVFGEKHVIIHLIVGLGEDLYELLRLIERLYEIGTQVSLFAFTPIKNTPLQNNPPPSMNTYRLVQLATELISQGYKLRDFLIREGNRYFIRSKFVNDDIIKKALLTRGCPGCNRPYYNEIPGKEPYNFPKESLITKYKDTIKNELNNLIK